MDYAGLSSIEDAELVRKLLLTGHAYVGFELPKYFNSCRFANLLLEISSELKAKGGLKAVSKSLNRLGSANHKLYLNKDGKFSWRVLELQHPAIYSELVNTITKPENWREIKRKLARHRKAVGTVFVASDVIIPCESGPTSEMCDCNEKRNSRPEEEIKNWASLVEKKSLALAIQYNYMVHADIFDFYGQIYTHTIAWALHGKAFAKAKVAKNPRQFEKAYLGGTIDYWLRKMREGQSNGIPQGSALMDLLAEVVLSYADTLLDYQLRKSLGKNTVFVLRYRDDYRIFVDGNSAAELALKELSEVLRSIGLRLNERKTRGFDDIVIGSIKPDKWSWFSVPRNYESPFHYLLAIYSLLTEYDSAGQVLRGLKGLRALLEKTSQNIDREYKEAYLGILVNIAYRFPRAIPQVVGIISLLVEDWPVADVEALIKRISHKFTKKPAHDFLEIWLQRLAMPHGIPFECGSALCRAANGEQITLWNSEWIEHKVLKRLLDEFSPIDEEEIGEIEDAEDRKRIPPDETELFYKDY